MSSTGLSIKEVTHSFDGEPVLHDVTTEFPKGSLIAILGPSGCGKTTLLRCAAGLLRPMSGEITLDGALPEDARRHGHIGCAFQAPTLLPWRTALQNVLLPIEILKKQHDATEVSRARELLSVVELGDDMEKIPNEMSGGMQQRVGLARALVTYPSYLFLDEPFGQLDGTTRNDLNEKVRDLWLTKLDRRGQRTTIMFVTHGVEEAVFLAEFVVVLTRRPARIYEVVEINLPTERDFNTRYTKEFFDYANTVRKLTEEAKK